MRHTRYDRRNRLLGRVWLSYAAPNGGPALRKDGWLARIRDVNGFGVNLKNSQHWFEFRRCSL